MSPEISERSFEEANECRLLQHDPDAPRGDATVVRRTLPPCGDMPPGGYRKRRPKGYDRALCLLPRDVVDFVLATQPKEWQKLTQHSGAAVKEQFLKRLAAEIERRGALDVLRNGINDSGCKFRRARFFDQYLRTHRNAEELIKRGESKTLEFKSTLRWNLKQDRQDEKHVTHAVLKTIAAFLNTEGSDLLDRRR